VSKGVEDSRKAVSGVSRPQGVEGYGMAGLGKTLGSTWLPLAIRPWLQVIRAVASWPVGCTGDFIFLMNLHFSNFLVDF
jgi:hypothetical protein